jgi:HD-like signal output (HDOD) protein
MKDLFESFEIRSFPATIMEALRDLRDPDQSLGNIAHKLEGDPGITVKILRTVNAAAFGLSKEVANLQSAITMAGHARLETILLAHAVEGALPFAEAPNFTMKQFWTAASQRACLARNVAARLHPSSQVEAFTAGLLLDMAVPILVRERNETYVEIFTAIHTGDSPLHELETEKMGFNHADLGGHMAKQWNLPAYLTNAITNHHRESDDGPSVEPGVRIASLIGHDTGLRSRETVFEMASTEYGLDRSIMEQIVALSIEEAEDFAE